MKCGEFPKYAKHKITLQQRADSADGYGGTAVTWSTLATVWAAIEPMSGREPFLNDQIQSRVTHKVTIRYMAVLKNTATAAKNRFQYDGRQFSVKYIKNLDDDLKQEGNVFQVLMCEENDAEN